MSDEFTNKKTQMASKHIKIWLTSQLTKGIHWNHSMITLIPFELLKILQSNIPRVGRHLQQQELFCTELAHQFGKQEVSWRCTHPQLNKIAFLRFPWRNSCTYIQENINQCLQWDCLYYQELETSYKRLLTEDQVYILWCFQRPKYCIAMKENE